MPAPAGTRFVPQNGVSKNEGAHGTVSYPTPSPMSVNCSTETEIDGIPDYKYSVNGILPGYSGHVPRARDKYAGASSGAINLDQFSPPDKRPPQKGCTREEDVVPEAFSAYVASVKGVMPGYTGYRPASKDVFNVSAYGQIPADYTEALHERSYSYQRKPTPPEPDYLEAVGGVLPKYAGFVPMAVEKHGVSHYGKTHPTASKQIPLAQAGHETMPMKESSVAFSTMPGYQGHIPQARVAFGVSYFGDVKKK